jgi:6-phosphogluconolactonase (cycloisomerase 2 family)
VVLSPNGRWLYATRGGGIYRRAEDTGKLERITVLADAREPAFSPDSRFLYVPKLTLAVYTLGDDPAAGPMEIQRVRDGRQGVFGMPIADQVCVPSDGKHLYVANVHDQSLVCFERDAQSGKLAFLECLQDDSAALPVGEAPISIARIFPKARTTDGVGLIRSMASSPDGKQLLIGVSEEQRLVIFDRNPKTGHISLVSTIKQHPVKDLNGIRGVESIAFSENGEFLVTASLTGGISLLTRDPALRKPTFVEVFRNDDRPPGAPQETPIFPWIRLIRHLRNPTAVAFLPGDFHLIAASSGDDALHAFRFDPKTPALKWIGTVRDGENGITGLKSVRDLAISPDGRFLYAASANATVAVFEIKL